MSALRELAEAVPRLELHVQGYAVGRPVPPDELAASWLARRSGLPTARPEMFTNPSSSSRPVGAQGK